MSEAGQTQLLQHTEPGPFQKYLFSGACYVRIGQCYGQVKALAEGRGRLDQEEELIETLSAVWNDFLAAQFVSEAGSIFNGNEEVMAEFNQEVRRSGTAASTSFLESLKRSNIGEIEFRQFFGLWAESCDSAYRDLVASEPCSRMLGNLVNTMILVAAKGHSGSSGK